jgi:hypothetical protein
MTERNLLDHPVIKSQGVGMNIACASEILPGAKEKGFVCG